MTKQTILKILQKSIAFALTHLRLIAYLLVIVVSLMVFEEIVDDVFYDPLENDYESKNFDESVAKYVHSIESQKTNEIMRDLTSLGSISVIVILSLITGLILAFRRKFDDLMFLIATLAGSSTLVVLLKSYFERDRPPELGWLVEYIPGYSFPSGHSMGATTIYLALAYLLTREFGRKSYKFVIYTTFSVIIVLVGVSRIYLGVHYPTDVIAGVSAGVAWTLSMVVGYELLNERPWSSR